MLDQAYYQIWRPGPDPNFVTDRHFSSYLTECCDGYASCENRLRKLLSSAEKNGIRDPQNAYPGTYQAIKKATFELQESVRQVLKANGKKTVRCVPAEHIALLEPAMKLSCYQCSISLFGSEFTLSPFHSLTEGIMENWYLERAGIFSRPQSGEEFSIMDLVTATAAVRCLLYAQFGPVSETALSPAKCKGEGTGYFKYKSLFHLVPPEWPEEKQYGFSFSQKHKIPLTVYPF